MPKAFLVLIITVTFMAGVFLGGCTTVQKKPPASDPAAKPYKLESEGEVPPLAEKDITKEVDRAETFEEMPVTDNAVAVENVETPPVEMSTPAATTGRKTMDGYRVQVMASGNEEAAQSVRSAISARLGMPAYVDFVDGVHKVRVGDCPTREAAEALRDRCREAGYGDAWIVSGKIFMPERTDGR